MSVPSPISVLHFSTADRLGGSARSAWRIHSGLRDRGHRSRMLVGIRTCEDPDVDAVWGSKAGALANRAVDSITSRLGLQYAYFPTTRRVLAHRWVAEAQVFQLYNTHGGYFATDMLALLSQRAPIVWRLSDMWPLTGHCAYSGACERWRAGCGECPDLGTWPAIGRDTTARMWRMKDALYSKSRIHVIAPSSWTEQLARQSPLFARFAVWRIPNGIDLAVFRPRDKAAARAALGIDPAAKVIAFVAHGVDANPRKGSADAIAAVRRLEVPGVLVLLAGEGGETWSRDVPFPVKRLGFIRDDHALANVYGSADLLLAPSRVENLPNTVLEALACGTPVVATDAGGMRDAVRHLQTGWLAAAGDAEALSEGMRRLLLDDQLRARLSGQARRLAEAEFSRASELAAVEALYRRILA